MIVICSSRSPEEERSALLMRLVICGQVIQLSQRSTAGKWQVGHSTMSFDSRFCSFHFGLPLHNKMFLPSDLLMNLSLHPSLIAPIFLYLLQKSCIHSLVHSINPSVYYDSVQGTENRVVPDLGETEATSFS